MRSTITLAALAACLLLASCAQQEDQNQTPAVTTSTMSKSVHDFTMTTLDGQQKSLKDYAGKVLVIVNVASKCGYTPQYADLQKFYSENESKGVVVLGFPANNFMGQEPGSNEEIAQFCQANYGVSFPMFAKISVKGDDQHALYKYLTEATGENVSWNFNKFVIGKDGKAIRHFKSGVKPDDKDFQQAINQALGA